MTSEQDFSDELKRRVESAWLPNNIEVYRKQVIETLAIIDNSCPDSPLHPDTPEFWFAVENGEDEERLAGKYYFWKEEHLTKAGSLRKEYKKKFFSTEIPCPDCKEILGWTKVIGYNNHRHVECADCGWNFHE